MHSTPALVAHTFAAHLRIRESMAGSSAPLIFLDIDGVICCNDHRLLEDEKLKQLQRICKATGASVVLSSDWRRQQPLKQKVQRALQRLKITYVGATSVQTRIEVAGNWRMEINPRPVEITDWLRKYRKDATADQLRWVAIDDRDLVKEDGGKQLEGHFVITEAWWGLTSERADAAIAILRGQA